MRTRTIAEEAARLLAGLGETPGEIAATLRGAGYRGVQANSAECPCGSCLADHLGATFYVRLDNELDVATVSTDGDINTLPLATHVRDFVRRFDAGRYPSLIAHPAKP